MVRLGVVRAPHASTALRRAVWRPQRRRSSRVRTRPTCRSGDRGRADPVGRRPRGPGALEAAVGDLLAANARQGTDAAEGAVLSRPGHERPRPRRPGQVRDCGRRAPDRHGHARGVPVDHRADEPCGRPGGARGSRMGEGESHRASNLTTGSRPEVWGRGFGAECDVLMAPPHGEYAGAGLRVHPVARCGRIEQSAPSCPRSGLLGAAWCLSTLRLPRAGACLTSRRTRP
jgi:hypothetical protein